MVMVSLTDTLVAQDIATSLLSVWALANKNAATLFLPKRAIMFDMDKNYKILGQAEKYLDGLYHIED